MGKMFAMRDRDHQYIKDRAEREKDSMAEVLTKIIKDNAILEQLRQSRDPRDPNAMNLQLIDKAVNLGAEIETLKVEMESLEIEAQKYRAIAKIVTGETLG